MLGSRVSDNEISRRDIPSFIEPRPPLISNPFMRPRPQKGTNLLELFEDESECEEPELVQVYLRLKPCNNPSNLYEVRSDRYLITSLDTATAGHGRRTQHNVSKMYTFSQIFGPETNQKGIFENVVKDNLKKLPEGNSFTLLTYGASGSGKTFTLMGTVASPGLVPRSLEYVFKMVDAAQIPVFKPSESGADKLSYVQQEYELQWMKRLQISAPLKEKYRRMSVQLRNDLAASHLDLSNRSRHYVWVSFIEIYNEGIYDLLAPGERKNAQKLAIREDSSGNVYVKGATQAFVRSGEEAYDIMVAGKHNLQVAATGVHAQSSRSHCIFTITMLTEGESGVSASHVRLCDLAGCERAARTRNTGARMCESRAINASLHVLERCLRALRRRRRAAPARPIVPYRESKLTRLLGSCLSGSRGEAVAMVVTLNPSPEYADETKHVLQLAAVAKDIQINNTLSEYPSSLEITQNTTIEFSAENMKLRADNERLHFELVQAQTRNKELLVCMEQRQGFDADAVRELVDEARDIMTEYYEEQLRVLRDQMDEMALEYESKLNATEVPKLETLSRSMETKINQLMTDIAILEEKLAAEKLARERVEEEVQHLRACIEERDEKSDEAASAEVVSLTDSDSEEEDPCNESLEPSFKKEHINKSRILRQSAIQAEQSESDNSLLDKTNDTLKDYSHAYETSKDVSGNGFDSSARESVDSTESNICTVKKANIRNTYFVEEITTKDSDTKLGRETYCVTDISETFNNNQLKTDEHLNSPKNMITVENDEFPKFDVKMLIDKQPNSFVNKIISSIKKSTDSNNSLAQFERLELAAKTCHDKLNTTEVFTDINILKEKRNFFDNETKSPATKERKIYFDNLNIEEPKTILDEAKHTDDYRSPSIVKEEITHDFTPSMIKKLLGESKRQGANMVHKAKTCSKTHDSIDMFDFDSPQVLPKIDDEKTVRKSVPNILISDDIETNDEELITYGKNSIVDEIVVETSSSENVIVNEDVRKNFDIKNTEVKINNIDNNAQYITRPRSPYKNEISLVVETSSSENVIGYKDVRKNVHIKNTEVKIDDVDKNAQYIIKPLSSYKNEISSEETDLKIIKTEHTKLKIDDKVIENLKPKRSYFEEEIKKEITVQISEYISEDNSNNPGIEEEKTELLNEDLSKQNSEDSQSEIHNTNVDNTIEQFDNIYKDVTSTNVTDFELLLSQEIQESSIEENNKSNNNEETDDVKYNLRNKKSEKQKPDTNKEIKNKPKRMNLRLRRRKNLSEDDDSEKEVKFRDIVNLQSEFSDVTMDVPASAKPHKDIPSPEKVDDENLPPILGIQSCLSKSVTRSRRKLFTPRAEPLEEGGEGAGASGERVCVARPSYHRPRARRKL